MTGLNAHDREEIRKIAHDDLDGIMGELIRVTLPENILLSMAYALENHSNPEGIHAANLLRSFVDHNQNKLAI